MNIIKLALLFYLIVMAALWLHVTYLSFITGFTVLKFGYIFAILLYLLMALIFVSKEDDYIFAGVWILVLTMMIVCYTWALPSLTNASPTPISSPTPNNILSNLPTKVVPVIKEIINSCDKASFATNGNAANIYCGNLIIAINAPTAGNQPDQGTSEPIDKENISVPVAMMLSREYQWVKGSIAELETTTEGLKILEDQLKRPGMQKLLAQSSQVVAVGTASVEGEQGTEKQRARDRAKQIMISIKKSLPGSNSTTNYGFYYLNLGKYNNTCNQTNNADSNTGSQRPIIVVGVLNGENSTKDEIENQLKQTLSKLPKELKSDCYSDFEFTL